MSQKKLKQVFARRKPAVQVELDLPPQSGPPVPAPEVEFAWWQEPAALAALAGVTLLLGIVALVSQVTAHRDRRLSEALGTQVKILTLRPSTRERALRIVPNPRSWSAIPDATISWPEPPELLDLYLPVAYSEFPTFALTIDKVDIGRVMIVQRAMPDSNRELRLSLNSSAFGPGEYRIRIEGYTWRGGRVDAGWVRLVVK
jgi:hypothetical protein